LSHVWLCFWGLLNDFDQEKTKYLMMDFDSLLKWTNDNSGFLALLLFLATSSISFVFLIYKSIRKKITTKPSLNIIVIEQPTMCSSFATGKFDSHGELHRTAFLIYLKIINDGEVPVQIGDIHIGYKSANKKYNGTWFWLTEETILLEDYASPIGDKHKVYPFLKQQNHRIQRTPITYLRPSEDTNGLVYFEQNESSGMNYPSIDTDFRVQSKIIVHDTKANKWSVEHRIIKVQIEPIREICPVFGLSKQINSKKDSGGITASM